jgi:hypothetical protein
MREKRPVPWYWWPIWMFVLALGLLVFYVFFTPVWMGIRLISWLAERRNLEPSTPPGAAVAKDASERARDST